MKTETEMLIDPRKKRIRLAGLTLEMMGNPSYIWLLVNPETMNIAVCPAERHAVSALKVTYHNGCAEFYSQELVNELVRASGKPVTDFSCRIPGFMKSDFHVAEFSLREAKILQKGALTHGE